MRLHNLKVGETYYAVTDRRIEKGVNTKEVHEVRVLERHPTLPAVLAQWPGRTDRWYFEGVFGHWRRTRPILVPKCERTMRCATRQEIRQMKGLT
jgi:hypothetical protein